MDKKVTNASSLKVGGFVILDDKACKITDMQISKTGKHGHAKCKIAAVTIKDNLRIIKIMPGHDKVEIPIIEKETAQVLSISGNKANVMDLKTYETFDLTIPDEMKNDIKEGDQVIYWIMLGEKVLMNR